MKKITGLRPGMMVNIVMQVDLGKELIDVKNALVYEVNDAEIILSQTTPFLLDDDIDKEITITYHINQEEGPNRIGFSGKVVEILKNYNLRSAETVQALKVTREGGFAAYDLRMHYRVKPKSDSGIQFYVGGKRTNLIDISVGGALFCHTEKASVTPGNVVDVLLVLDGEKFNIEAKSVNVWHPSAAGRGYDLEYVSVQFFTLEKRCENLLSGKILSIQRELLSKI